MIANTPEEFTQLTGFALPCMDNIKRNHMHVGGGVLFNDLLLHTQHSFDTICMHGYYSFLSYNYILERIRLS